jgi:hypothetical protein
MLTWTLSQVLDDDFESVAKTQIRSICDNTAESRVRLRQDGEQANNKGSLNDVQEYGYTDILNWLVYPGNSDIPPGCRGGALALYVTAHLHARFTVADCRAERLPPEYGTQTHEEESSR